mmetsp:Transcript_5757/g.10568  ORF Transcript_5757/g.10568 Transcript_5757/m.10568 type:complete len:98 (-) Transcript_5757:613-906(-)
MGSLGGQGSVKSDSTSSSQKLALCDDQFAQLPRWDANSMVARHLDLHLRRSVRRPVRPICPGGMAFFSFVARQQNIAVVAQEGTGNVFSCLEHHTTL